MFAFLNVNRDQRGRHVHVDTGIIDCGNGGVRRFELSRREYKSRNLVTGTREKRVFRRLAIFTDGGKLKKISSRWQKQTVGRVSGNKTFFFLGLIP